MRRGLSLCALALALALAGCGVGAGAERAGGAQLRVTRDFGSELIASARTETVREGETVMRFLQSRRDVDTAHGGGFVDAIDGLEGGGPGGTRDWFYFVNGLQAEVGAAARELTPGDVVQWDFRDWRAAMSIPAIVGAYPEPFVHGIEGKRLPTRVECASPGAPACIEVTERLEEEGVVVSSAPLGAAAGEEVLRVAVGSWPELGDLRAARAIAEGPQQSGVFARFGPDGGTLDLLDGRGGKAERGSGIVAATGAPGEAPTWLVTGVDEHGVEAAARLLDDRILRDRFAVAATSDGARAVPVQARERGD